MMAGLSRNNTPTTSANHRPPADRGDSCIAHFLGSRPGASKLINVAAKPTAGPMRLPLRSRARGALTNRAFLRPFRRSPAALGGVYANLSENSSFSRAVNFWRRPQTVRRRAGCKYKQLKKRKQVQGGKEPEPRQSRWRDTPASTQAFAAANDRICRRCPDANAVPGDVHRPPQRRLRKRSQLDLVERQNPKHGDEQKATTAHRRSAKKGLGRSWICSATAVDIYKCLRQHLVFD